MGREELITDPRLCTNAKRVENRAVLRQALASADLTASGMLVEAKADDGPGYRALGLPYSLAGAPRFAPSAAPRVGADSAVLLADAGYTV